MAVATAIAATGAAMGIGQTISGIIGKNKAQKALDNLEVPELTNAFEGIQISTEGSDLMREENQRNSAMLIDAARSGGVRSVMANLPMLAASNNNANREARTYLDDQINKKQYAVAQDNQNIRAMEEQRYMGDVQGLNNMIQSNRQDIWSGIRGIGTSMMYAGRNMEGFTPQVDTVGSSLQSQGLTPLSVDNSINASGVIPISPISGAYTGPVAPDLPSFYTG